MEAIFKQTKRSFTISTIVVALVCALLSSLAVYALVQNRLNQQVSAADISNLTENDPAVSAYLASQEPYHAHFESIASVLQQNEQQQITTMLPIILGGVFLLSGIIGWILARRLLEPVRESYTTQRRFLQDAAHELRNPLAAMRSIIQQAGAKPPAGPQLKMLLKSLDKQAAHLSDITTDLLLLERKEGRGNQRFDAVALLEDIVEDLHHVAMTYRVGVVIDAPKTLIVRMDPQHFVLITKNLIENAIKFSKPEDKPVHVALKQAKTGWSLTVQDYGIGIPKAEVEKITQRFYRSKNATRIDGTGLGMAIVDKFVRLYGGTLSIKSVVNRGTTMEISL